MIHSYDRDHAARLVPLLESIFAEVADRRQSIRGSSASSSAPSATASRARRSVTSPRASRTIVASSA